MIIFHTASDIHAYITERRFQHHKIGFVPTMGALHQGHISLILRSKKENELTVCSIFINPTQFNNPDDYAKYPITIDQDILKLEAAGCDLLFLPGVEEIYPDSFQKKHYDLGFLETILEGKYRPGHFQGVCMVVDRLLQIVACDCLYLGEKDYQQCMVIQKMLEITQMPIKLEIAPTERESDGLAMSSRNMRLTPDDRITAGTIYEMLNYLKANITHKTIEKLCEEVTQKLHGKGFDVDYVAITDRTLAPVENCSNQNLIGLIAASLQGVRLIDNLTLC